MRLPTYDDVYEAQIRLKGHAYNTPLIRSDFIDQKIRHNIWFKPECNQKVGAFKYRGAFNRLSAMTERERQQGVVAFSSGNHAQGVSRAARELGISAVIVMPSDAPEVKVAGVIDDNAKIVFYDRQTESREEIAAQIAKDEGRVIVPSFDDPFIIAGQGTVGLEVIEEASQLGLRFDALITCIGGGGLCAGISLAVKKLSPATAIYGAEPENYNDHQMSLRSGYRVGLKTTLPTLCDALMTPKPGELTFMINQHSLADVFTVSDEDCLRAMALAYAELGVRLEPGGAVAMAALLNEEIKGQNKNICVILSGGNVDPEIFQKALDIAVG